jgi:hypothetical protein
VQRELGYWAMSTTVTVDPGATRTLDVDLDGSVRLSHGNRYVLRLGRQPLEAPDSVEVVVDVPKGWRIRSADGLRVDSSGRRAVFSRSLKRDTKLVIELEHEHGDSLWNRLEDGPSD